MDSYYKDQPPPTHVTGPSVWDLVIAEMQQRDQLGRERYGTPLQVNNGRDALQDLSEELIDGIAYLRQLREELKGVRDLIQRASNLLITVVANESPVDEALEVLEDVLHSPLFRT